MSTEMMGKVTLIMQLALLINPTATGTDTTGDRPTVMFHFYGHVNSFIVEIYPNGWHSYSDDKAVYETSLDPTLGDESIIDAALTHLAKIYKEIQEGKDNDAI